MRHWRPYHHHTIRLIDHNAVMMERQLKTNTSPAHLVVKAGIEQLRVIHTTPGRARTAEQNMLDRSTDHEDAPRRAAMTIYSDMTSLIMPGPKTADGLHQSYVTVWPNTEAPCTLFASQTK